MRPLVSVIIPSYNRPLLLKRRSIPSVLAQTYPDWELLVVGDGPEGDALCQAAQSFGDRRIRYAEIPRPDYSGLSAERHWHAAGAAARNHGLELAKGDIIAPLDDDDEFLPDHLADSVGALTESGADFAYGFVWVRDLETGQDSREDWLSWNEPATRELFLRRNIVFHSSVAYSRRYAHLRYPTDGRDPADYALWLTIHAAGATITSLDTPQAVCFGDGPNQSIRVSVPSLPTTAELEPSLVRIREGRTVSNTGPICAELEEAVGRRLGLPRVVSAPSGDIGLLIALQALRLTRGRGRRGLVLPSYAHPSLVNAALWNGFEPVFCDVDPETLCLTPATVEPHIRVDTAVIAALHPHGHPCDMPALERLAQDRDVALLGDAAGAFGAAVGGRPIGGWGNVEVFSLSGTKSLTAGEGGLVCSRDPEILECARRVGRYGIAADCVAETPGINGKLAELPAAMALAGLAHIERWLARRRQAEATYRALLSAVRGLRMPRPSGPDAVSGCKDAVLILDSLEAAHRLRDGLRAYRIDSRPYYRPLHRMPAYSALPRGDLRSTNALADCTVCVPLYNEIRDEVIDLVIEVVRQGC